METPSPRASRPRLFSARPPVLTRSFQRRRAHTSQTIRSSRPTALLPSPRRRPLLLGLTRQRSPMERYFRPPSLTLRLRSLVASRIPRPPELSSTPVLRLFLSHLLRPIPPITSRARKRFNSLSTRRL